MHHYFCCVFNFVLQSLLLAHDSIAERESKPVVHGEESDLLDYPLVQYGEDSVKIIHLEKTNEHLVSTAVYMYIIYQRRDTDRPRDQGEDWSLKFSAFL